MSLLSELKRRNVLRVATAYVVASWLIIQVAETILPAYGFGEAALRVVITLLAIAMGPVLVFSWVFELTPEGFKREVEVLQEHSVTHFTGKKLDRIIIVMLVLALGYLAFDKFILQPARETELVAETAQQARSEALVESFGDRSVAVLPFLDLSANRDQEYFSDGISEELLNLLSKIPDLRVISRSSAFSFKGTSLPVPSIAQKLNVAHVLEGSVRQSGDKVRITAQLIEARSDTHLWSETYDRNLTARNIFQIQSEIAKSIAQAMDSVFTSAGHEKPFAVPTENLEAYYAYHLGRQRMATRTEASLEGAIRLFRQAINLDPDYAVAYVGLADTYMLLGDYGGLGLAEMVALTEPALLKAMELDADLAPAYASFGAIRSKQGDFLAAENSHLKAIELDPGYATTYHWYADLLVNSLSRPGEAVPLLRRAIEMDPLSPAIIVTLGQAYEGLSEFEKSMAQYVQAMEIAPDYPGSYMRAAALHHYAFGRLDEAAYWREEGLKRNPGQVWSLSAQGLLFLDLGDVDRASELITRAVQSGPGHFFANRALAFLHRYRGSRAETLAAARRLEEIVPGNNASLLSFIAFGEYREAIESQRLSHPELFCDREPQVTPSLAILALNLSLALERTGQQDCADRLLVKALERFRSMPRLGSYGFGIADVEALARRGKTREALDTLRQAVDAHWRGFWWSQGLHSLHLDSLRSEPEFEAMMSEIRADMASQLARVNASMEGGRKSVL
jgi:TolB-like protein/Tfp pilus assembly protein PilF